MASDPTKIEIYVDGSWLGSGKKNPALVGGWGAIIISHSDSGTNTRFVARSTPYNISSSFETEMLGILSALKDVRTHELRGGKKAEVILHTDQLSLVEHLQSYRERKDLLIQGDKREKFRDIEDIFQQMHATCVYAEDPKCDALPEQKESMMSMAHQLARQAAWAARMEKQGGKINFLGKSFQGKDAEDAIDRMITSPTLLALQANNTKPKEQGR